MRITLLLALLLAACAAPRDSAEREDRVPPASGPSISIGGGLGTYYGNTR